jgi:talin
LNVIIVQGRQLQEPILSAARNVVDGACRIIECSKILIINSKEASLWQQLAAHTKSVSEAIKRLATSVKYVCLDKIHGYICILF